MIKISIIIPVYNQEELIVRCLDSIPKRDDIEVICVDDCSTDNSYEVMKNYNRIKIKLYKTPENKGPGAAYNIGLEHAEGEWLTGIDNDDYLYTDNYNKLVDNVVAGLYDEYDMVCNDYDSKTSTLFFSHKTGRMNPVSHVGGPHRCEFWSYIVKKSAIGDIKFHENYWAVDWTFMLEAIDGQHLKIGYSDIKTYYYDHPKEGSITWNKNHKLPLNGVECEVYKW